jgi:hypothetical protein
MSKGRRMYAQTINAAGVKADHCEVGNHRPRPLRFVWHHILPIACGGRSVPDNEIQLCDNCHYSIHRLMSWLAHQNSVPDHLGNEEQRHYAILGYQLAVAAGTQDQMPNE